MRRRVVSVLVGFAVGVVAFAVACRFVSPASAGPLIVAASAAVLTAMGMSELWLAFARTGRVMDAAAASVRKDDRPGPGGGMPVVTASDSARVVYDRDRLSVTIDGPRTWRGQHRMPKANAR